MFGFFFFCVCVTVNHQQRGEKQRLAGFLRRVLIKNCTFCQIWRTNRRRRRRSRSFFSQSTQVVLFFGVYFSTSTLRAPPPPPPLPPHKESPGGIIINNYQKKSMTATILSFFFLFSFYRCRRFTRHLFERWRQRPSHNTDGSTVAPSNSSLKYLLLSSCRTWLICLCVCVCMCAYVCVDCGRLQLSMRPLKF